MSGTDVLERNISIPALVLANWFSTSLLVKEMLISQKVQSWFSKVTTSFLTSIIMNYWPKHIPVMEELWMPLRFSAKWSAMAFLQIILQQDLSSYGSWQIQKLTQHPMSIN